MKEEEMTSGKAFFEIMQSPHKASVRDYLLALTSEVLELMSSERRKQFVLLIKELEKAADDREEAFKDEN